MPNVSPAGAARTHWDPRWLALAVLCTVSVLILTHLPQDPTPEAVRKGFLHIDKGEHFLAYGVISLFAVLSRKRPVPSGTLVALLLGVAAVALADEMTQPWTGRDCAFTDMVANLTGVAAVGTISYLWRR